MCFFCRPEALGVVTGCVFLITLFIFIPVPFSQSILKNADFPHDEVCLMGTYNTEVREHRYFSSHMWYTSWELTPFILFQKSHYMACELHLNEQKGNTL